MTIRAYDHYIHTGTTVYGSEMLMGNLRSVVKECLVNGTGGVPAAGWTLEYDAGGSLGTFVLGNQAGDFFICFHRMSSNQVKVSIAATFEGVDANGVIEGEGARSGLAASASSPHLLQNLQFLGGQNATDNYKSGWSMIANGEAVALAWAATANNALPGPGLDTTSIAGFGGGGFAFGKTSKGCGFVTGAMPGSSNAYFAHPGGPGITIIHDPESGFLIPPSETISSVTAGFYARTGNPSNMNKTADWTYEDLVVLPLEIMVQRGNDSCTSAGHIPGFMMLPSFDIGIFPRQKLRALGMDRSDYDSLRLHDLVRFHSGDDGYRYALPHISSHQTNLAAVVMTDNPQYW